jgi:hypothetical protein
MRHTYHDRHTPHNTTPLRNTTNTPTKGGNRRHYPDRPSNKGRHPNISPPPEVGEVLMGFTSGDTTAEGLSPDQRIHLLGKCTDLNLLRWTLALISTTPTEDPIPSTRVHPGVPWANTSTFSQPLPNLAETQALSTRVPQLQHDPIKGEAPPRPLPWTPKFCPEEWVSTDGSNIKGHPRLGASVVHIPSTSTPPGAKKRAQLCAPS